MVGISTLDSPFSNDLGFNAPNFDINVQGASVPLGIRRLVQRIEYESSDGMADVMKIVFRDPTLIPPKGLTAIGSLGGLGAGGGGSGSSLSLRETKVFLPGNEISLSLGYGTDLNHVGRAVIRKVRPNFPREEIPTVEVIAYTADSRMMDNAPEKSKKKGGKGGRAFKGATFAEAVRDRAADYGFVPDVDDTLDAPHNFIQKVGLTDYDFVNGLSNLTGFFFWVDGEANGTWNLHFKNPDKLRQQDLQSKTFTFEYNHGQLSSLLDFEPELAIQGSVTKLQVKVKHPDTGVTLEAEFEEENDNSPDPLAHVTDDIKISDNILDGDWSTASDIKLFINDFSFEVRANRRFTTEAELVAWAKQWFRRNRENFVLSNGTIIGVESILARQIHKLKGLNAGLDGEYFFSNVAHIMEANSGYTLECGMRKVVPTLA